MQIGWEVLLGFSEVYVVFENVTTLWWLRFLKPGFRHCYLLLVSKERHAVVLLNPKSNQIDVTLYTDCDSEEFVRNFSMHRGITLCRVHVRPAPLKCAPFMAFTCVEFVKRVLGLHDFSIFTPYQLYKKIKNSRKNILTF